ncbi:MAG: hypothetical protein NTW49_07215 [Bacteroidia bacterium]|nr:hypothetical protein [Bacteroidia bacterium]
MKFPENLSKIIFFLLIASLFLSFFSCNKKDEVPYVPVNFSIQLNDPDFSILNSVGNFVYVTGGVNGIIIYRVSGDQFMAYDRTCTFRPMDNCRVTVEQTHTFAVCKDCCSSKFLLLDGSVTQGPASVPLKQYQTSFNGVTVSITN